MIKEQKKYNERAKIVNDKLKINLNNTWVDISLEDYEDIVIIGAGANSIALAGCNRKTFRKDAIKYILQMQIVRMAKFLLSSICGRLGNLRR